MVSWIVFTKRYEFERMAEIENRRPQSFNLEIAWRWTVITDKYITVILQSLRHVCRLSLILFDFCFLLKSYKKILKWKFINRWRFRLCYVTTECQWSLCIFHSYKDIKESTNIIEWVTWFPSCVCYLTHSLVIMTSCLSHVPQTNRNLRFWVFYRSLSSLVKPQLI